jgi:hypothetical protein
VRSSLFLRQQLARAILAGRKTQIRVPIRPGQERCSYEPGHSYVVQARRGGEQLARVLVTDVREELLHEISEPDVHRMGFGSRRELFEAWWEEYREGPGYEPPYIPIRVSVLEIERDRSHRPHLLAAHIIAGKQGPYTENWHNALPEEPEAIDDETLERYAAQANQDTQDERERRRLEHEARSLTDRLAELERAEAAGDPDAPRYIAGIRKRLDAAERALAKRAA